jgi:hypothetical protein
MQETLLYTEWITGLAALLITAMAFTDLAWGDGASSQNMQKKAMAKAKRLFIWAGALWATAILCYLHLH